MSLVFVAVKNDLFFSPDFLPTDWEFLGANWEKRWCFVLGNGAEFRPQIGLKGTLFISLILSQGTTFPTITHMGHVKTLISLQASMQTDQSLC